ncbi:MAG: alkaline phosphatase family protein [Solirubrobacterales bacterium]
MKRVRGWLDSATAAASSLTGQRFGLLVASSLVATAAIVASALTTGGDNGALAALLSRGPAAEAPAASGPTAASAAQSSRSSAPSAAPATSPGVASGPVTSTEPPAAAPPVEPSSARSEPAAPTEALPEAGRVKHVFVISLVSSGFEAAFGETSQMPYLAQTLRPQGELLSGYSLLGSAGLPNGIAAVSGQPPNAQTEAECPTFGEFPPSAALDNRGVVAGEGCVYPVEALTLADQLVSGRFRWRAYMEAMVDETGKPDSCAHPDFGGPDQPVQGGYAARHNPFVYFHSLLDLGDCAVNDVSLTELSGDLGKIDSTPDFALISPSLCNAGVTGQCPPGAPDGPASADAFLAQWVPKILASPAYEKDGLLIVTFGELNPPDPASGATVPAGRPQVGALLLSRFVSPGATDSTLYDPYSLLRTIEDLFGLEHLGLAGGAKVKSFASGLLGETRGD